MTKRDWPIVVRRARASDRDAVLAFATSTWDGWDYIPAAWPEWIVANDGVMLVACRPNDDRPVAITRVALVSPTEAWLEGIRVDPEVRGMEVASDLQVAELAWVAAQGATVLRYATSARNEGSHKLGARDGIELLFGYRNYWWSDVEGDPHEPSGFEAAVRDEASAARRRVLAQLAAEDRVAGVPDTALLWEVVRNDASFNAGQRLYEPRPWALGELTADRFARHVERGEVVTAGDGAVAIILREQLTGEDSALRLALLTGEAEAVIELVDRIRAILGKTLRFRLPQDSDLDNALHDRLMAAGYRSGDWALHILGRPIDATHPIPAADPQRVVLAEEPSSVIKPLSF